MLESILAETPVVIPYDTFPKQDVVLYGGGRLGQMAVRLLQQAGVRVTLVIDRNAEQLQHQLTVPVQSPDEALPTLPRDTFLFNCVFKETPGQMETLLRGMGFMHVYTVYDLFYAIPPMHFTNGWHSGVLSAEDHSMIRQVYAALSDDASREAYRHFLLWRIARKALPESEALLIPEEKKYFNSLTTLPLLLDATLLDVGAFDLFFTVQALNKTYNPYRPASIIAMEPDPESYARCVALLDTLPERERECITLSPRAISDIVGEAAMHTGSDLASRLVEGGKERVQTTTLDALGRKYEAIRYIKLHVEGAELPALKGGVDCITRHRPIVVANCAHTREGLWEIARFLMQHTEGYQYYFRAYANYGEGLSFYAVPA
ncbi:MAG: FkbM family methyltransferase [Rickettsiales bacterium]|nr:FkbM family methyltransferase [Rickettsiales bacterium]